MSFASQLALTCQRISDLRAPVQVKAWALLGAARYRLGIWLTVVQGRRTAEDQRLLWLQGRDPNTGEVVDPAQIVTNAKPGQSRHEEGAALDVARLHEDGRVTWNDVPWNDVGILGEEMGLLWGGRWQRIRDRPHFEEPRGGIA